jgi:hypothetical protein
LHARRPQRVSSSRSRLPRLEPSDGGKLEGHGKVLKVILSVIGHLPGQPVTEITSVMGYSPVLSP